MKSIKAILITSLWVAVSAANANVVILDTSTLPSTQGWEYAASGIHAGVAETDLFSVNGSVLTMDNLDEPVNWRGGAAFYRQQDIVESSKDTVLQWTSRTTEHEKTSGGHDFGFFMNFDDGQYSYRAGITDSLITLNNGAGLHTIALDATIYHTYRIETVTGQPAYDFYIDNTLQATLTGRSTSLNTLRFGDTTSTANAKTDITELQFCQIPEPMTASLLLIIFPMLLVRRNLVIGNKKSKGKLYFHLITLCRSIYLGSKSNTAKADRWV